MKTDHSEVSIHLFTEVTCITHNATQEQVWMLVR